MRVVNVTLISLGIALLISGILLVFVYMLLVVLSSIRERPKVEDRKVRGGALVMVGPIPIICATDTTMAKLLVMIGILMLLALLVFLLVPLLVSC